MNWNNGTIFRVYVVASTNDIKNSTFNTKVNINQQLLNNKVVMGIENLVLYPSLDTDNKKNYWANVAMIQLASLNLPSYIDYTSVSEDIPGGMAGNTSVFGRIPLILASSLPTVTNNVVPRFIYNHTFNKDSIMYEMLNNPNALANGNLNIKILDETGNNIPNDFILSLSFTLVVYKPDNKYN
jgi:hypothetical protein